LSIDVSFSPTVFTSAELASVQCMLLRKMTSCSLIEILRNVYTKLYEDACLQPYLEFLTIRDFTQYLVVCDLLQLLL